MSDPHFQTKGTIDGLNPSVRLRTAIDHINANHADADFAVLTGDMVGDDTDADYPAIAEYLSKLAIPFYALMGNNDSRDGFRQHLPLPATVMPDFIQYTVDMPDGILICLDTHVVGSHAGEFCAERMAWLESVLRDHAGRHVYIFMHHPPMALGLPAQDAIMMAEGRAFLERISACPQVKYLFMGHVHRPTSGVVAGIPFATLGALSFQAPAPRPAWEWDSFEEPQEAPQYAVVHINDGDVVIQYTQFCAYAVGVED